MRKIYLTVVVASFLAGMTACGGHEANELAHNHSHDHGHAHEAGHHHDEDEDEDEEHGGDEIVLHPEDAERFGVVTGTIIPTPFHEVIEVAGRIVNTTGEQAMIVAPTGGTIRFSPGVSQGMKVSAGQSIATISSQNISGGNQDAAAKARLDAAKRELDRITPLLKDGIVTNKDYNAARQAYDEAKALFSQSASSGRVSAPISGIVTSLSVASGEYVEPGTLIGVVAKNATVTLQALLPEQDVTLMPRISDATFRLSGSDRWLSVSALGGNLTGTAPGAENFPGYIGVYFTLPNNGEILPGMYAEVRLTGAERGNILSVPVEAISEQQGEFFVYRRIDSHGYEKMPVTLGKSDGMRVEILSGIEPGQEIVVGGTAFVKLAESSGNVPEGHSHNH